jgi:hypothetical protein
MTGVIAFWTAALAVLGGLLFWRNKTRYRRKSMAWLVGTSTVELTILFLTATFLPALLIVWLVVWATRSIARPWVQTTLGVLTGVLFGFLSNVAVEGLILLGVCAIDMKTGQHDGGFLQCWQRAKISEARSSRQERLVAAAGEPLPVTAVRVDASQRTVSRIPKAG